MTALLRVRDLHVQFDTSHGIVRANSGVNLDVREGESVGIMGESGCGKTVLFLSLLRLQQPGRIVSGSITFDGRDITLLSEPEMESVRGRRIALVPQNHATALNPAYTVRDQLIEAIAVREDGGRLSSILGRRSSSVHSGHLEEIRTVFNDLGFSGERVLTRLLQSYPHELSGGMRQRVLIAMALLMRPRLLIADEPTTALDRATRAQSLEVLRQLNAQLTMLVVSHDLDAIRHTCKRVAVMYAGRIVEEGPADEVLTNPRHPYSRLLISAQTRKRGGPLLETFTETSDLIDVPPGCPFHRACPQMVPCCIDVEPRPHQDGQVSVACHLYREAGPC